MSHSLSIQKGQTSQKGQTGQTGKEEINRAEINAVALKSCDIFRGLVDPSEYKHYILVFLFFKYVSDVWKDKVQQYHLEYKADEERIRRRLSRERFIVPEGSDFDTIYARRHEPNIGEIIDAALASLEEANKARLEGLFRNLSFNSEAILGGTKDRNRRLKRLIEDFADPRLDLRPIGHGDHSAPGNAYQYFIEVFASDEGKKGGDFSAPPEV